MLAAFMGMGVWAVVYLRARKPSLLLDLLPMALLFVGGEAAGIREWVFARMYVAVFL